MYAKVCARFNDQTICIDNGVDHPIKSPYFFYNNNFAEHFNRNWLEYRKSVTEAGDWASVEWSGKGATFTDVMGRKFIDWLGGFGMFDLGWTHPDVVAAVVVAMAVPWSAVVAPWHRPWPLLWPSNGCSS